MEKPTSGMEPKKLAILSHSDVWLLGILLGDYIR